MSLSSEPDFENPLITHREVEKAPVALVTTDDSPSAIRLAALEQSVIFASNHYSVNTKNAHQVIQDAKAFEGYINGNVS